MILPLRGLGQFRSKENFVGPRDRADLLCHMSLKLVDQSVAAVYAGLQRDEGADRLPLNLVLFADDYCLSHLLI
jgi:hypothetical protein